jgi:GT2 family glycosyltransferase
VLSQNWPSIEIIVIDNKSTDDTVAVIRRDYPNICLLVNPRNEGFSRAQNRLIAQTIGKYYMPLNPDVVLTPDYVEEMVKIIESGQNIGWVSGKLLFLTEGSKFTKRIYTTGHCIYRNGLIENIGYGEEDSGQYDKAREVFGANGAAPVYCRSMLEDIRVGPNEYFDKMFFMYGSDPELDWRARILGWHCWYTPKAIGYHVGSASRAQNRYSFHVDYIRRRYIMILKCAETHDILFYYIPMLLGDFLLALRYRNKKIIKAILGIPLYMPKIICKRRRMMRRRCTRREEISRWFKISRMHVSR